MIENYGLAGPTGAEISECGLYRYLLWRTWAPGILPPLGVIMLNPSTADARVNDPTITRVMKRAIAHSYGGIIVGNLYGFRATEPKDMKTAANPVGPHNDYYLLMIGKLCPTVLCAWGTKAERGRAGLIKAMLQALPRPPRLVHLGLTKDGHPKHPLYIKSDKTPETWK